MLGIKITDPCVVDAEDDLAVLRYPRHDQVLQHLVLRMDGDPFAVRQFPDIHVVAFPIPLQADAVVEVSFANQTLTEAKLVHQCHDPVLEYASPDGLLHLRTAAALQNGGVDAGAMEQMSEEQACGPCTDDSNLASYDRSALMSSLLEDVRLATIAPGYA